MRFKDVFVTGLMITAMILAGTCVASADMPAPNAGFYVGAGAGLSGAEQNGVGARLKIGYNFAGPWRLYFVSQNHGYFRYLPEYDSDKKAFKNSDDDVSEMWLTSFAGIGADYFLIDQLALNVALGVSSDRPLSLDSSHTDAMDDMDDDTPFRDIAENGVAWSVGFSIPILGNANHSVSLDPNFLMTWAVPEGGQHIMSRNVYSLNVLYNFH